MFWMLGDDCVEITPEKIKKLSKWLIGVVTTCILIFLGVQNIDVVANTAAWCISLVTPLILGFAFAIVINVPMRFFESHIGKNTANPFVKKIRRPVCFVIALTTIIGILVGVIGLVIPELAGALKVIIQSVVSFVNRLNAMSKAELAELPMGNILLNVDWDNLVTNLQMWIKNQSGVIMNTAFGTVTSLVNSVFDFFVAFVFCIYILFNKETLKNQATRLIGAWLNKDFGEWLIHASSVVNKNFRNFISGQSLEAVILGLLCTIGMLILQIPYAPMVGALVGVTALIPVMGAFIGTIVGAFMILTVNPIKAIVFVVYLVILQQIEGNLIYPRVMGSRVNLPGMWILASVTVGGGVGGAVGMLLSVPLASSIYVLIKDATLKREQECIEKNSRMQGGNEIDTAG